MQGLPPISKYVIEDMQKNHVMTFQCIQCDKFKLYYIKDWNNLNEVIKETRKHIKTHIKEIKN